MYSSKWDKKQHNSLFPGPSWFCFCCTTEKPFDKQMLSFAARVLCRSSKDTDNKLECKKKRKELEVDEKSSPPPKRRKYQRNDLWSVVIVPTSGNDIQAGRGV